tara:strand:+ start:126 stop:809 length:684 start_codon:yes stop_codon:yes gene_type:complete
MMKVLIVEDEHRIAKAIKEGLEDEGYAVDCAYDGSEGYSSASADDYDAIVMDVMMPEMSGYEVAKKLRDDGNNTPILLLTARDQDSDIVAGLDSGADDYLAKPFSFEVLLARIRSLLRRPESRIESRLVVGDLTLDSVSKTVSRSGKVIELSAKEFSILEYLMRNKGRVVSKEMIMKHVWDFDADILPNNVEVFVSYIRNKIDKPFSSPLLHTVRGFGYKLEDKTRP